MELALSGKRRQILTKLRSRLPKGNFVSDVDPSEDTIYFHRSKPLPDVVVLRKNMHQCWLITRRIETSVFR